MVMNAGIRPCRISFICFGGKNERKKEKSVNSGALIIKIIGQDIQMLFSEFLQHIIDVLTF